MLSVPIDVMLGEDIHVHWSANNGLDSALAQAGDWIGLFKEGACPEVKI